MQHPPAPIPQVPAEQQQVSVLDSLPKSLVPSHYKRMDTEMYRLMLYKMKNLEYNQSVIEHFLESLHGSYNDHFNRLEKRILRLEEECEHVLASGETHLNGTATSTSSRLCRDSDIKVNLD